jgi:hypothetical protein
MMGINSFEQVKQVDRGKGKIHDSAIFSVAIGNWSADISTTEKFGKLLRAYKLTIGIFIVLAAFGLYPSFSLDCLRIGMLMFCHFIYLIFLESIQRIPAL